VQTAPPKPITIQHQNAPFQVGTAVSGIQNQKDAADGAARFVKQSEIPAAQEKVTATSSKTNDKKQSEKIPASLGEETPKSIPNQVKKEEQNNIPQEAVKNEKMNVVSAMKPPGL